MPRGRLPRPQTGLLPRTSPGRLPGGYQAGHVDLPVQLGRARRHGQLGMVGGRVHRLQLGPQCARREAGRRHVRGLESRRDAGELQGRRHRWGEGRVELHGGYSGTRAAKCPLCQDDHVPPALERRIRKARVLSARVARAGSGRQAEKLQTRLARSLGAIARLIARAEAAGRISPSCAQALQTIVVDARVRAERGATPAHPRAAP